MMSKRSRLAAFVSNALLNLAAVGGVICVLLVVAAFTFNITLIMFKTGSMGPGIPAGSVAVVQSIDAGEVQVGDVVTVDRPGLLPVTHRVTSVSAGTTDATRQITMKGDANSVEDPAPYLVSQVGLVLLSVPGLAPWIIWMSNAWVLGALALGASALVTWAFWPRDDAPPKTTDEAQPRARKKARRHARKTPGGGVSGASAGLVLLLTLVLTLTPQAARADTMERVVTSVQLSLTLISDESAMTNLVPGVPVPWQVGVTVTDAADDEPGEVQVYLAGSGSAALQLNFTVRECAERWVEGACATGDTLLRGPEPVVLDGTARELTAMPSTEERWLLFELWRSADASLATGDEAVSLRIQAVGSGDAVTAAPGQLGTIAHTGVSPRWALSAAIGSLLLGFAVTGLAHLRQRMRRARRTPDHVALTWPEPT